MHGLSFREAEHAGWSARAESYDSVFAAITSQAIPQILAAVTPVGDEGLSGRTLLDLCCGPGHLAAAACLRGARAEGIDFAESMVARASGNYPAVPFRHGDAEHLPYRDTCFDAVACAFGVMHLEQPDLAIAEAWRVLRPAGAFAFTQWAIDDTVLGIVATAVAKHGQRDVVLPEAPPLMRFCDPAECRRTLGAQGFANVSVTTIDLEWRCERPEEALALIHGGALRASMLIEAQPADHRSRVEGAIVEAVRARRDTAVGGFLLPRPAVLATGWRP